jgi:Holliday junction resolvase RusA-like endonuclease
MIHLKFELDPVAKGRPRFGKGFTYTPAKTKKFENWVKTVARLHMSQNKLEPMQGPLEVIIHFYLTKPKSSKNRYPIVKPDLDNFTKGINDSLNEVFWNDDAQIVQSTQSKNYCDGPGYFTVMVMPVKEFKEGSA